MGTTVTMYAQYFEMSGKAQDRALEYVKDSFAKTGVENPYELDKILTSETFNEVAEHLGWGIVHQHPTEQNSHVTGIKFNDEKLHVKVANQFFTAIADFVASDCFVYIKDEYDVFYNWDFSASEVIFTETNFKQTKKIG